MDELKARLEFLEHISNDADADSGEIDPLKQIDELSSSLHELLAKRQEVDQLLQSQARNQTVMQLLSEDKSSNPIENDDVRSQVVMSRVSTATKFADDLEMNPDLTIPSATLSDKPETTNTELYATFDNATTRSAAASQKWLQYVARKNSENSTK